MPNSVIVPSFVIRPIARVVPWSVNQMLAVRRPAMMAAGRLGRR